MALLPAMSKIFGDWNAAQLKKLSPMVGTVRAAEAADAIRRLTMEDLPKRTLAFKDRVRAGETLEDILPEAFAVLLRACELLQGESTVIGTQEFVWNMQPFDVQILGGIVLHRGNIAEMKTGEGKTLVCTMPAYLNALGGQGVHIVTVNDYLARRDAQWMGVLYKALGLTVGTVVHGLTTEERKQAYACDITYGTNNEFGFDYLRDNMVTRTEDQVQSFGRERTGTGLHYAIVDEVDSILIDEARTPLIISQPAEESTAKYLQYARLVQNLQEHTHFVKDEKQRTAALTEAGIAWLEQALSIDNIYTEKGFQEVHHIEQALRAHAIYQRDVDYVSKDDEIIIVDEFTGRLMPGRRYGHGLHQAIEAKENVEVQRESKTLATITFQNYFRLYKKLAGMTGTAKTEEEEFESIYKLRTLVIPTHRPMVRSDLPDSIYRTVQAKFQAVVAMAKEKHASGQPVLIGTTSIEKSEALSLFLEEEKIPHSVLNAKNHQKEAEIVALAGQKGSVTIATNMAGRGTDIKLGEGVAALGGLCILGTERHESRRIDNQLRGRSGRQGDPGESRFFVSMEDDLMRLFGGDRLKAMMERLKVPDDVPLQNRMVSRSIEGAQKRVEGHHFDVRKHVLQYDDVMNKHREIIYKRRQKVLEKIAAREEDEGDSLHRDIVTAIGQLVSSLCLANTQDKDPDRWQYGIIREALSALHPDIIRDIGEEEMRRLEDNDALTRALMQSAQMFYERKCAAFDMQVSAMAEKVVTLRSIDTHWMDHIDDMSHLREQVAFSGFAQRDPVVEYQDQGFRRFQQLLARIAATIVQTVMQIDFTQFAPERVLLEAREELSNIATNEAQLEEQAGSAIAAVRQENGSGGLLARRASSKTTAPPSSAHAKIGRNDPCPCGAQKADGTAVKYKHCHGAA